MAERVRYWTLVLRVPGSRPTRAHWLFVAWTRHFTLIVPWFGGHVKPLVPSEVLSTYFRM